jgi:hypothetical protein
VPCPGKWGHWTGKGGCEMNLMRATEFMKQLSVTGVPKWSPFKVHTRHNVA